jgi:hypothetical protein
MSKVTAVIKVTRHHSPGLGYWDNEVLVECYADPEQAKEEMYRLNRTHLDCKFRTEDVDVPEDETPETFVRYFWREERNGCSLFYAG